jgi:hypothetical protein
MNSTRRELLVAAAAREIQDSEIVFVGTRLSFKRFNPFNRFAPFKPFKSNRKLNRMPTDPEPPNYRFVDQPCRSV